MKILAADDEQLALEMLVDAIKASCPDAEIYDFMKPSELLCFAETTPCDVAFLDIQMRGMTGVELARQLKARTPRINIIFVTGFDDYTGDAMALHASGYILKPVTREKVTVELADLRHPIAPKPNVLLRVKCFGNFDVYSPDGERVRFERSKAKEMLAYLIYKKGASCTIKEIAAVLFEDEEYDSKQRGYVQKIVASMIAGLKAVGAELVVKKKYNSLAIDPEKLDCDFYRFEQLDPAAVNSYEGEFMVQYSWAEFVVGYLEQIYSKQ